jgi:hypothetical protein
MSLGLLQDPRGREEQRRKRGCKCSVDPGREREGVNRGTRGEYPIG